MDEDRYMVQKWNSVHRGVVFNTRCFIRPLHYLLSPAKGRGQERGHRRLSSRNPLSPSLSP